MFSLLVSSKRLGRDALRGIHPVNVSPRSRPWAAPVGWFIFWAATRASNHVIVPEDPRARDWGFSVRIISNPTPRRFLRPARHATAKPPRLGPTEPTDRAATSQVFGYTESCGRPRVTHPFPTIFGWVGTSPLQRILLDLERSMKPRPSVPVTPDLIRGPRCTHQSWIPAFAGMTRTTCPLHYPFNRQ